LIHSFDTHLYLRDSSSGSIPKSSSPSFSTAQNPKSTPQHKLQKLTASTIKHFAKISKLRVPTTIVSTLLIHLILILPAPMNSSFHLHILSFHRAFSSMRISDSRIKYLGHILRHHDSAESFIMFNPSHPLRTISSPFRRGAWPAHWPELALAEAAHRATIFHNSPPLLGQLTHSFYQHFTIVELKRFSSVSMKHWYNTTRLLYLLIPISENREQWTCLTPKLK
jgi:hypothetical protein